MRPADTPCPLHRQVRSNNDKAATSGRFINIRNRRPGLSAPLSSSSSAPHLSMFCCNLNLPLYLCSLLPRKSISLFFEETLRITVATWASLEPLHSHNKRLLLFWRIGYAQILDDDDNCCTRSVWSPLPNVFYDLWTFEVTVGSSPVTRSKS